MNTEIYIESQSVDVTADVSVMLSYAIDDVTNIASRDTGFSKTIVLPGTAKNNRLFGSAFEFTAYNDYSNSLPNIGANFNAAKSAKCVILQYGIQVFKGVVRLMEIKTQGRAIMYEVMVVGELGGLMNAIGNRLLSGNADTAGGLSASDDLDFSDYNQVWNFTNIIQSWADLSTLGYLGYGVYFPLVDYGKCTTDSINYSYQALRPSLYVHEYIVKIFEKTGYTYDCPIFETNFFKRLIIPHNEDSVYTFTRLYLDQRTVFAGAVLSDGGVATNVNVSYATSIELNDFTGGPAFFTYSGAAAGDARITTSLTLDLEGGEGRVLLTCELRINGTAVDTQLITVGTEFGAFFTTAHVYLNVDSVTVAPGDVISVNIARSFPGPSPTGTWEVNVKADGQLTATFNAETAVPAVYGDDLNINNCVPKGVLQRDYLLSIIKMFNLRIIEDPQREKHLYIAPFIDLFDNSNPIDWTDKVDRSREISLTPMSEVNARYFNFLYEKDTDYDNTTYYNRYAKGYADRTVDVGLDFVKEKKDLKIIFAPSPFISPVGYDKGATRIMKVDSSGVEERISSKIRILQAKRIAVTSWNVLQDDLTTVINNTAYYGYAGHVDDPSTPSEDLNFGTPAEIYWTPANPYLATNLVSQFYTPYLAEITDKDSKLLKCYVYLTPIEMNNLDFSRSILIDGQLWRLQKVEDYNAVEEDVCKVSLLKVINMSY